MAAGVLDLTGRALRGDESVSEHVFKGECFCQDFSCSLGHGARESSHVV